ncbi:hypothetical protein MMC28_003890, partial [Mycoblastus sanguinarius]|nr:hypothetical protein [Mycoblastus sanguinarius]
HHSLQYDASKSPLLRLPGEIRDIILRLVIGHRLIHVIFTDSRKWCTPIRPGYFRHCLCSAAQSENEAYEEFMEGYKNVHADENPQYYSIPFKKRHAHCKPWDREDCRFFTDEERMGWREMPVADRPRSRMSLSILGACRQMSVEANHILWTTNTFSFEDPHSLEIFMNSLNPTQRKTFSAIHCEVSWEVEVFRGWAKLMKPEFVQKLAGIRTLHATFVQDYPYPPKFPHASIVEPLSGMQILPLNRVTVVLGDMKNYQSIREAMPPGRWTVERKRQAAEELRTKLLDRKGSKVFIAE